MVNIGHRNRADLNGVRPALEKKEPAWGLKIALYLFLGGIGAGSFGLPVFLNLVSKGQYAELSNVGAWVGLLSVGLGSLLLLADLGVPWRAWRLVSNTTSMISVGVVILTLFLLLGAAYISFNVSFSPWYGVSMASHVVGVLGVIFAFATAAYTGLLMGVVKARPFWNTPLLPILWVISSLSAGIAATTLIGGLFGVDVGPAQAGLIRQIEVYLLVIELVMIGFYLAIMHSSVPLMTESVRLLVAGKLSLAFWLGLIGFGLALPLIFSLTSFGQVMSFVSAFLVLVGTFFLRYTFLVAGLRKPLPGESLVDSYL